MQNGKTVHLPAKSPTKLLRCCDPKFELQRNPSSNPGDVSPEADAETNGIFWELGNLRRPNWRRAHLLDSQGHLGENPGVAVAGIAGIMVSQPSRNFGGASDGSLRQTAKMGDAMHNASRRDLQSPKPPGKASGTLTAIECQAILHCPMSAQLLLHIFCPDEKRQYHQRRSRDYRCRSSATNC